MENKHPSTTDGGMGLPDPREGIGEHSVELLHCPGEGGGVPRLLWDFGGAV